MLPFFSATFLTLLLLLSSFSSVTSLPPVARLMSLDSTGFKTKLVELRQVQTQLNYSFGVTVLDVGDKIESRVVYLESLQSSGDPDMTQLEQTERHRIIQVIYELQAKSDLLMGSLLYIDSVVSQIERYYKTHKNQPLYTGPHYMRLKTAIRAFTMTLIVNQRRNMSDFLNQVFNDLERIQPLLPGLCFREGHTFNLTYYQGLISNALDTQQSGWPMYGALDRLFKL